VGAAFLVYNGATLVNSAVLRSPEFGDTDTLDFTRTKKNTLGNDLIIFADPIWPRFERLKLEFTYLTQSQCDYMHAFVTLYFGTYIYYVDFENRSWLGFICSPTIDVTQESATNFTMGLEFEGFPWGLP
jgi:hypothetical protein